MAFMCIVNNPGSWAKIFAPLRHAGWDGCTPTDLVYPFFVFCMGCAMAFSLAKYERLTGPAAWKIIKRGIGIFLVGLAINLYPFFPTSPHDATWTFWQNYGYWLGHKRILGVLQRIAMCYVIAGLVILWLKKEPKKIGIAILSLFTVFTGVLLLFGKAPGPFTLEGNAAGPIDIALLGEGHVYHGYGIPFDPEGFLGSLTGACTALLGFLVGSMVRASQRRYEEVGGANDSPVGVVAKLFVCACVSLALGEILSIRIPINKPLWSASYVLYAGGWAMLCLGFLSYLIDVKGYGKFFTPAKAMGMNALMAFVLSGFFAKTFPLLGWHSSAVFGANAYMSLLYAILFMLLIFAFQWFFYKKDIVIKL